MGTLGRARRLSRSGEQTHLQGVFRAGQKEDGASACSRISRSRLGAGETPWSLLRIQHDHSPDQQAPAVQVERPLIVIALGLWRSAQFG